MKTISLNAAAILSGLVGTIQQFDGSTLIDPNNPKVPGFIRDLGLRFLTFNSFLGESTHPTNDPHSLFNNCRVIPFADWSDIDGASDLWDGLLLQVIKPLRKKDFEFIFYLGDPTKKLVQEVDEILDIISDFSYYGRVTLILDEEEASKLWQVLNGYDPGTSPSSPQLPGPEEKYLSIFNTININNLLIYGADQVQSLSKQQQFALADKAHTNVAMPKDGRNNFNAGYCLGLQLQLEIPHCVALGLAASGSYRDQGASPDQTALLSYIKNWMAGLEAGRLPGSDKE